MNSSSREKATAASAEFDNTHDDASNHVESNAGQSNVNSASQNTFPDALPTITTDLTSNVDPLSPTRLEVENLDPDDFDHEFDDDFEAEIPGEYELDDDEYARALLDIVDFEIEGLEMYRDDDE